MTRAVNTADRQALEQGAAFTPRFGPDGLLPAIVTDAGTGEVLMLAWMNALALRHTLETGEAHYWSRSRASLWRKGAESGQIQRVVEIRTDCDQDTLWLRVRPGGDGGCCHAGFRSCFYRSVTPGGDALARNAVPRLAGRRPSR